MGALDGMQAMSCEVGVISHAENGGAEVARGWGKYISG